MTEAPAGRPLVPAISAHRGGRERAPSGTIDAYAYAIEIGADFAELDVRLTADGQMINAHDGKVGGLRIGKSDYRELRAAAEHEPPLVADVLALLAGRVKAHIDLKDAGAAGQITRLGLDLLGPAGFVITTGNDAAITGIKRDFPHVQAALTVDLSQANGVLESASRLIGLSTRSQRAQALARLAASGADWVAMSQPMARAGLAKSCRKNGIKTMVWTVNTDAMLTRWIKDPSIDVVVTDLPAHAIALRSGLRHAEI